MKFLELHERLRLETWRRIDQGVLSSSLLARQAGIAQAHISNFLHRRRRLSLPALDRILRAQALSVEELSGRAECAAQREGESMDTVPIVAQSVAITSPVIAPRTVIDSLHLPPGWLKGLPARRAASRRNWERFVAVRVSASQALAMDPVLWVGSLAVIDRHYNSLALSRPAPSESLRRALWGADAFPPRSLRVRPPGPASPQTGASPARHRTGAGRVAVGPAGGAGLPLRLGSVEAAPRRGRQQSGGGQRGSQSRDTASLKMH